MVCEVIPQLAVTNIDAVRTQVVGDKSERMGNSLRAAGYDLGPHIGAVAAQRA
jgi:hypothetical protein